MLPVIYALACQGSTLESHFYHHVKYQALSTFKRVSKDWNGNKISKAEFFAPYLPDADTHCFVKK